MTQRSPVPLPVFGVYGASGCGRGVMPVADSMLKNQLGKGKYRLVFVDDGLAGTIVNGRPVLSYPEFINEDSTESAISIAIADTSTRERLAVQCRKDSIDSFAVRAPNSVVMDNVQIGPGAIVSPFVTFTSNIVIGQHFHANLYSYVEHDSVIGDFVTFAPCVKCNGNVIIEDRVYVGAGAILKQGKPGSPLKIGKGAIIGMGAVVTKDVAAGDTVIGNPARKLEK